MNEPKSNHRDGNWHRDGQFQISDEGEEKKAILKAIKKTTSAVQVQIALIPIEDVEFVPGSHLRYDTVAEYRIRRSDGEKHNTSNDMPGAPAF